MNAYSINQKGQKTFHTRMSPADIFGTDSVEGIEVNTFQLPVLINACYFCDMAIVEKQINCINNRRDKCGGAYSIN